MKNIALVKLKLKKAERNLEDYLKTTYLDGIIKAKDERYISIWDDYRVSRETLIDIDSDFFSLLDSVSIPPARQMRSFYDKENAIMAIPSNSRDIIKAAIDNALSIIESYEEVNSIENESSSEVSKSAELIIRMMSNWSNMVVSFKEHRKDISPIEITNEYEMQYLLEGVLRLLFNDVRPETYTANYANKSNRTDFLLPKERILIECKMTREGLNDSKLSEELIIDKEHYRRHHGIDMVLCLVYDPERRIKNPEGIKDIQELVEQPYFSIHFSN
jgi:hypothetical protein